MARVQTSLDGSVVPEPERPRDKYREKLREAAHLAVSVALGDEDQLYSDSRMLSGGCWTPYMDVRKVVERYMGDPRWSYRGYEKGVPAGDAAKLIRALADARKGFVVRDQLGICYSFRWENVYSAGGWIVSVGRMLSAKGPLEIECDPDVEHLVLRVGAASLDIGSHAETIAEADDWEIGMAERGDYL